MKDQGFEVCAFPCNQFAEEEPGTPEEIITYAKETHGANFMFFEKCNVNGNSSHAVYNFLRKNSSLNGAEVSWNFAKFLVNSKGEVVKTYDPNTEPNEFKEDIQKLLN